MTVLWRHIVLVFFAGIFVIHGAESCITVFSNAHKFSITSTADKDGDEADNLIQKEACNPDNLFYYSVTPQMVVKELSIFGQFHSKIIFQSYTVPTPPPWSLA